jgi:transposase-like protein/IS1 family transposase
MVCHVCNIICKKFGKFGPKKIQRYRCKQCGKTFSEYQEKPLEEMRVPLEKALQALHLMVEGNGIRSISRITGLHIETVLALLKKAGERAAMLMDSQIRNVAADQVQVDEIWSFVHCKQKNVKETDDKTIGDQYTFVSFDRESKLVLNYVIGKRTAGNAQKLMDDLVLRLGNRPQISTDGFAPYVDAVEWAFGANVDYAQLVKVYAGNEAGRERYSPSECVGAVPSVITGHPDPKMICTSHVERNNLTMRIFLRRLTRLTLGFSKKLENLKHAIALHFAYYNFCRVHRTLRVTPAMEAGIADHVWTLGELIA